MNKNIPAINKASCKTFSLFYFIIGAIMIAPFRITIGDDAALYYLTLLLGALVGGWAFLMVGRGMKRYSRNSAIARWSLRMMAWAAITFIFFPFYAWIANLPLNLSRAFISFAVTISMAMYFFLGLYLRRQPHRHRALLLGAMTSGLIYMGHLIYILWVGKLFFSPDLEEVRGILSANIPTWPSRYPMVLLMLAFIALALQSVYKSRLWINLMKVATLTFVAAVIYSLTRAAWVGLAISMGMFVLYRLPGWKFSAAILSFLAILLMMKTIMTPRPIFTDDGTLQTSPAARITIWNESVTALERSPIFGYGQQGTGVVLEPFFIGDELAKGASAHNDFVDMTVRSGIPGILMYLLLVISLFLFSCHRAYAPEAKQDPSAAFLAIGLLGMLGYGCFHELIREPISGALFWFIVGSLAHEQSALKVVPAHQPTTS